MDLFPFLTTLLQPLVLFLFLGQDIFSWIKVEADVQLQYTENSIGPKTRKRVPTKMITFILHIITNDDIMVDISLK